MQKEWREERKRKDRTQKETDRDGCTHGEIERRDCKPEERGRSPEGGPGTPMTGAAGGLEESRALYERLLRTRPEELPEFLRRERGELLTEARPFAAFMRRKLREKGLLQQNVFLAADLSESYGYKLIAEEKHTRQRDTILRLCLAAQLRPEEAQEALILYGIAPLYVRFARDAVLLAALHGGIWDLQAVNRLLESCGQAPLLPDYR